MISTLLKNLMLDLHLNQAELAEVMEVKLQRVRDLASGRAKKLTREESELLIGKLDIRAEWLISGEGPMLQDDESQDVFVNRIQAIKQMQAVIETLPLNDMDKKRLGAIMTGDPAEDFPLIAAAIAGGGPMPALNHREAALLDNYRHCPPEGQEVLEKTSAAFAQPKCGKKAG
ncbi:MAG: hypothetical protein WC091_01330 [Sulfuricellaceae bacterium]